jgi:hypothetical protein
MEPHNAAVTKAIIEAERLCAGSPEAREAWRKVSEIEESIATMYGHGVSEFEHEIAILGAVTAAIKGGDPDRAIRLADRYLGGVRLPVREQLIEHRDRAMLERDRMAQAE